ncbi:MAG: GTPase Era [Clostridia bacterium]|nr:GTPase Era [Clostridia bacterium]MBO7400271.1 GTPase Era [Clostridia bacterium]MBO7549889.1 GTPase Era [Clostridia bacterium]MBP5658078.1 GTPase Era [Clostridia bacterium]MBR5031247.1 GTPase Era [Clostridia bacterium]
MDTNKEIQTKSVFVMITGRPNVGKSTLLNALVGEKVAIVSKKPQTTRNRITGVLTDGADQYVFIDTPGIHTPKNLLGKYMMNAVGNASDDADAVMFVVDASVPLTANERKALESYSEAKMKKLLIINKVDITDKTAILEYISKISSEYEFDSVIPVSALNGDGVEIILKELKKFLAPSPHFFPDDLYTDQPEKQIASEVIREKALRLTDDEIPHGIAVVIEEFKEKKDLISIRAELFVEKQAHKKIVIGKNGEMLKKIGTYAREDLEKILGSRVFLDIWVKVKENWRDRQSLLNTFGYGGKDE